MVECEKCGFDLVTYRGRRWKLKEGVEGKKPDLWTCPKCGHVSKYHF